MVIRQFFCFLKKNHHLVKHITEAESKYNVMSIYTTHKKFGFAFGARIRNETLFLILCVGVDGAPERRLGAMAAFAVRVAISQKTFHSWKSALKTKLNNSLKSCQHHCVAEGNIQNTKVAIYREKNPPPAYTSWSVGFIFFFLNCVYIEFTYIVSR